MMLAIHILKIAHQRNLISGKATRVKYTHL